MEEVDRVRVCMDVIGVNQEKLHKLVRQQLDALKELKRLKHEGWNNRMYDYLKALEDYEAGVENPRKL